MANWKIVSIERKEVSREEVVAVFGEEAVAKYEKDLMLGVNRPLERKYRTGSLLAKVSWLVRSVIYNVRKLF